ncbi:hypothetical protein Tco_0741540 [Tanacetum coccineum]
MKNAVLTRSGLIPVSAARAFNTAVPKPFVNVTKPRTNAFQKSHSPVRRPFYHQIAFENRNLNNKVDTAKVMKRSIVGFEGRILMIDFDDRMGDLLVLVYNLATNGHQFTMSTKHQELATPKQMALVKSWLVQDQTVPAMAIPGQTATVKELSNPFMAGSLPKTISPMIHLSQEVIHLEVERTV